MRVTRSRQILGAFLLAGAVALCASHASAVPPPYGIGGYENDPFGDVTGPLGYTDGVVNALDVAAIQAYISNPGSLTPPQRERIRRYGDVSGVVNQTVIGNGLVDVQDSYRHMLLAGGMIDAGTAGPSHAGYGDVDGDGKSGIADAVLVHRAARGMGAPPSQQASVNAKGKGDISPTVPYVDFGDGVINGSDLAVVSARANGTESKPPAYVDYMPLHIPIAGTPAGIVQDQYTVTDVNGLSGDAMYQIRYAVQNVKEVRGYTVTEVLGDDGSVAGFFKGMDGSLYILYIQYPVMFNNRHLDFFDPLKLLNAGKVSVGNCFGGKVWSESADLGLRPTPYSVTVLGRDDVYTPAAGNYPNGTPESTWSKTLRLRLDIALLAGPTTNVEMQQALFYELSPYIGLIRRGQAPLRGSASHDNSRPYTVLDSARVRGVTYTQLNP